MVINFAVHTQHIAGHNFRFDLVVHKHFNEPYSLLAHAFYFISYSIHGQFASIIFII